MSNSLSETGVVIIGAGVGGLTAAVLLAAKGIKVTVAERMAAPGGKLRTVDCGGFAIDAGPTVFTARWIFDAIFADAGASLDDHLTLVPSTRLARHAWQDGSQLDLWADPARSRDAIAAFAGPAAAAGWDGFRAESAAIWNALEARYMDAPVTSPLGLALRFGADGAGGMRQMLAINPFQTLWRALGKHFKDPRLRQLYGRYATYCGASPFDATATLMLIAHLEARGVWLVDGGMHKLAQALAAVATAHGVTFRYNTHVTAVSVAGGRATGVVLGDGETIPARDVIANCDVSAIAAGALGDAVRSAVTGTAPAQRSLSGLVTMMSATAQGFDLDRHNVFFSNDYAREFRQIFKDQRLPTEPSVYICAQDRPQQAGGAGKAERFQIIVNAPATGDGRAPTAGEIEACQTATFQNLTRCGLTLTPQATVPVDPAMFEALFPSTGGALYGRVSHGWQASFRRPGSRSRLAGLWLAGGSAHPGAGVPMAALSGRLVSDAILSARALTRVSVPMAIGGGT